MARKQKTRTGTDYVDLIRIGAIVLSVIVLIAGALFLLPGSGQFFEGLFGRKDIPVVDFGTLVIPARHHDHYLVCPSQVCMSQDPDQISKVYDVPAERLRTILLGYLDNQPAVNFWRMDPVIDQFDFIESDPTMRMPDVITVRIFDLGKGQSAIAIYSRSLHGYAEKESNRRRVRRWLAMIDPD